MNAVTLPELDRRVSALFVDPDGHCKRTWLYYCGRVTPLEACWDRREGTHQVGWFDRKKPTLGKKAANETPAAFAAWLIELAARSTDTPSVGTEEKP